MKEALVVARREVLNVNRERLALVLLLVFLGMVLVSASIGWSTHHTVMSVYDETVRQLGRNVPNPFSGMSALELIKNTVIYIVLIGALLAIVVGARSTIRDRKAGVTDLILSRPIKPPSYLAGKLLGAHCWIGLVLLFSLIASWASVWVVSGNPLSIKDTGSLILFFAAAWLFLLPFAVIGTIAGMRSRHESTALLAPILMWAAVTFAIPQLGTAQNPAALLNPVPAPVSTTDLFFQVNRLVFQPVSITEHFKHLSGVLLNLRDITTTNVGMDLASLCGIAALSIAALFFAGRSSLRRPLYE